MLLAEAPVLLELRVGMNGGANRPQPAWLCVIGCAHSSVAGGCLRWGLFLPPFLLTKPEPCSPVVEGQAGSRAKSFSAHPSSHPRGAGSPEPLAQKPLAPLCLAKGVLQQQRKRGLAARAAGRDPLPTLQHWGAQGQMC